MTDNLIELDGRRARLPRMYERAFLAVREELDSLPFDQLLEIEIDIPCAVTEALGRAPKIRELLPKARH